MIELREDTFETAGGLRLYERAWLPADPPRGWLAIVHGYAEHCGRYEHTGEFLARRGYAVAALDLRGHGRSEGPPVLVRSFNEYLHDVDAFLARVHQRAGAAPVFLLGHSMGGLIVALATVARPPRVRGVLLSGAALRGTSENPRIVTRLIMLAGRVFPSLRTTKLEAATVSRDPAVVAAYDSDPLVYRGRMPAGTIASAIRAGRYVEDHMERVTLPLLVMHGTEDQLTNPEGSRTFVERAASGDKTLRLYNGLYHEILNEPERDEVLADIAAWLDARAGATIDRRGAAGAGAVAG